MCVRREREARARGWSCSLERTDVKSAVLPAGGDVAAKMLVFPRVIRVESLKRANISRERQLAYVERGGTK